MKPRTSNALRVISHGVALLFTLTPAWTAAAADALRPNSTAALAPHVKSFLAERWNSTSFTRGIAIVTGTNETSASRIAALQVLLANRKQLTPDETRQFLGESTRLAKDASVEETNCAFAVRVMANLALTLRDQQHDEPVQVLPAEEIAAG